MLLPNFKTSVNQLSKDYSTFYWNPDATLKLVIRWNNKILIIYLFYQWLFMLHLPMLMVVLISFVLSWLGLDPRSLVSTVRIWNLNKHGFQTPNSCSIYRHNLVTIGLKFKLLGSRHLIGSSTQAQISAEKGSLMDNLLFGGPFKIETFGLF